MNDQKDTTTPERNEQPADSALSASLGSPRYFEDGLEPKDGDWVRWRSNGERWMVSAQDDLDNPGTALSKKEWHDDVIFEKRP